ncbi:MULTISPECIES: response regulator [Thermodesulfovibrio]|uniref:response regulator n=1 Tax=Thermodesulfovibrio TaxID=28261 RepID=UPI002603CF89|nr:response regulator [Thermodesulfovibrio sp.]
MNKNYKFTFLILEDDSEYFEALEMKARKQPIEFIRAINLDEAREIYEKKKSMIQGIILDVIGYASDKQAIPDESSFALAKEYFRKYADHLPIVALTGHPGMVENVRKWWAGTIEVFSKNSDEEKMFEYLISHAKKLESTKIINKHREVFDLVRKYFNDEAFDMLLQCIRNMENPAHHTITGILANLRKLQEYFYIALNKIDSKIVPDNLIYPEVDNKKIIAHLKGNFDPTTRTNTTKSYIEHNSKYDFLLNYIYKICSEAIHVTEQNTTKYTVQSIVYAFMDLVLFLKNFESSKN